MKYSPKLKTAMEEIKAVLKKHDIAGVVVIHTPGFSEYLYKVDPSYSCASIQNGDIHFKMNLEHYKGNKKDQEQTIDNTVNMIYHLAENGLSLGFNCLEAFKTLNSKMGIDLGPSDHSSHDEQNN